MMEAAEQAIAHCRRIAQFTEEPGWTTRTFLSPPMHEVHAYLRAWMERLGMEVRIDSAGNLRGRCGAPGSRLLIGSHLDTVPHAGAFDGVLGVVLGAMLVQLLPDAPIEVIGFSEEEGVRFGVPFIGSRALIGDPIERSDVQEAIRAFGIEPAPIPAVEAAAYLEFHIEQGPVLESLDLPLGVVDAIAGQSRLDVTFHGQTNHAGTTPMHLRRDALAAAAEWIQAVECDTPGLVATVGRLDAQPNVRNAINGVVEASLDVRHAEDSVRIAAVTRLLECGERICTRRGLRFSSKVNLDQPAVPMDARLSRAFGPNLHHMISGAGHDAMIIARRIPSAMLFLRSPGAVSHHPDEAVNVEDIAEALRAGLHFLRNWEAALV